MRPVTPLAVENGVGKLAAYKAPNARAGKREWRTPIPESLPALLRGSRGTRLGVAAAVPGSYKANM
jgi:hypothetical protein